MSITKKSLISNSAVTNSTPKSVPVKAGNPVATGKMTTACMRTTMQTTKASVLKTTKAAGLKTTMRPM